MKTKLIRLFVLLGFGLISNQLSAQILELDEYRAEIGVSGGGSFYLGDANDVLFKNTQVAYGAFFRYRFNPRISLKAEIDGTKIGGTFTYLNNQSISLNNPVYTFDLTGEFNFFDLEKNAYKRFSKIFSPYIFAGVGMMNYSYTDSTGNKTNPAGISIPFGIGIKVMLAKRWNLNIQWSDRLLFADNLEGLPKLNNPNGFNGNNPFNNDHLSTVTVGISFDIWKKQCDCEDAVVKKDNHNFKKR
jgi:hypothetical protein